MKWLLFLILCHLNFLFGGLTIDIAHKLKRSKWMALWRQSQARWYNSWADAAYVYADSMLQDSVLQRLCCQNGYHGIQSFSCSFDEPLSSLMIHPSTLQEQSFQTSVHFLPTEFFLILGSTLISLNYFSMTQLIKHLSWQFLKFLQ